jgi:hypothetical protein
VSTPEWQKQGYESYIDWQYGMYNGMAMPEESWSEFWERYWLQHPS